MYPATLIPLLAIFATALPTTNNHAITIAKTMVARAPPEANAVLKSVTSAGTGCSGNSAQFIIKDNASMAFDSMIVESGEADLSKKCVVTIDLQLDPAWKYTINKATTIRGFVDHANATAKVLYTVAGQTSEAGGDVKGAALSNSDWSLKSTGKGVTSAAGGGVASIDVQLRLIPQTGVASVVAMDSIDIGFNYAKA